MDITTGQMAVTINALRIDNKKVSAALFGQFEEKSLLVSIGSVFKNKSIFDDDNFGVRNFSEDRLYSNDFAIIGRHAFKVERKSLEDVPFLFCVDGVIGISTVANELRLGNDYVTKIEDNTLKRASRYAEICNVVINDTFKAIELLSEYRLIGWPLFGNHLYNYEPSFIDAKNVFTVNFSEHDNKLLNEYSKQLCDEEWDLIDLEEDGNENVESQGDLQKRIKDEKIDKKIVKWFASNEKIIKADYEKGKYFLEKYRNHLDETIRQIMNSPMVYIGV